jgi:hypothetical protein
MTAGEELTSEQNRPAGRHGRVIASRWLHDGLAQPFAVVSSVVASQVVTCRHHLQGLRCSLSRWLDSVSLELRRLFQARRTPALALSPRHRHHVSRFAAGSSRSNQSTPWRQR